MTGMGEIQMQLPAVCPLGHVFPSGYALTGSGEMHMMDCTSGPCPECGGDGMVPNGSYAIVETILAYSRDFDMSREDMVTAARLVASAIGPGGVVDVELLDRAIPEQVPAMQWILQLLRDPAWQGVGGIGAIASILVAFLLR